MRRFWPFHCLPTTRGCATVRIISRSWVVNLYRRIRTHSIAHNIGRDLILTSHMSSAPKPPDDMWVRMWILAPVRRWRRNWFMCRNSECDVSALANTVFEVFVRAILGGRYFFGLALLECAHGQRMVFFVVRPNEITLLYSHFFLGNLLFLNAYHITKCVHRLNA